MSDLTELQKKVKELSKEYHSISKPDFTRSGSVVLDAILGGGIPKGVFILWSAENGCGKSTGALHISRTYCIQGKRVLYLDYEGGVNLSQIEGIGLSDYYYDEKDNPNGTFFLYQVQTYKDAENILDALMNKVDLVIIDSITAMLTEKMKGSSAEDIQPGQDSRVMSVFMKKYKADAMRLGVTWIMINQMRTHIRFMGVTTDEEAGGNAVKFYSDIRLQMKRAFKGTLEREEETAKGKSKVPFGAICTIQALKNRYERPNIPLDLAIIFGKGIDNNYAYCDLLTNFGYITKSGAWYTIEFDNVKERVQGMGKVISWIGSHRDLVKEEINKRGGYKLLLNEDRKVNLGSEEYNSEIESDENVDIQGTEDTEDNDATIQEFESIGETMGES